MKKQRLTIPFLRRLTGKSRNCGKTLIGGVFLAVLSTFSASPLTLAAAEYTWTGAAGNGWTTPGSWNPTTSTAGPGAGDTVTISTAGASVNWAGSEGIAGLTINLSNGTLAMAGTLKLRAGSQLNVTGSGNYSSGGQLQPGGGSTVTLDGGNAKITASHIQIAHEVSGDGTLFVKNGTVNVTGFINLGNYGITGSDSSTGYVWQSGGTVTTPSILMGRGINSSAPNATGEYHLSGGTLTVTSGLNIGNTAAATGRLFVSGGTLNAKNITVGSATSSIVFEQNSGTFLTGITCTGTATLNQGTLSVNVTGIQPVRSAAGVNLIQGGVGTFGMTVTSDFYDVSKNGSNLVASLKTDLPNDMSSKGLVLLNSGADTLTIFSNFLDDPVMQGNLVNWLNSTNAGLSAESGSAGAIVLQLAGMPEADALLWNLTDFNAIYRTNALLSQNSQVPEPAAWFMMILGLGFLGFQKSMKYSKCRN